VLPKPPTREQAKKIQALGSKALDSTDNMAPYITAILAWESGEVSAAYRLAEECLVNQPDDFRLLLICVDYHLKNRDTAQTKSYAERLLQAKNPARRSRVLYYLFCVILFPLRLMGYGRTLKNEADVYEEWVAWARDYVAKH
jgi:hypothetical protein